MKKMKSKRPSKKVVKWRKPPFSLRLTPKQEKELKRRAKKAKITVAELIRKALGFKEK